MIFNCTLTEEARKRRWEAYKAARAEWHDFFALWPRTVAVDGDRQVCAWLQTIQRKSRRYAGYESDWWDNEYRLKPD